MNMMKQQYSQQICRPIFSEISFLLLFFCFFVFPQFFRCSRLEKKYTFGYIWSFGIQNKLLAVLFFRSALVSGAIKHHEELKHLKIYIM